MKAVANSAVRRAAFVPVGMLVSIALLLVAGNLAGNGALIDPADLPTMALPGWEQGSLMRVLLLWVASGVGLIVDQTSALVLTHILVAGVAMSVWYQTLRGSDWPISQALVAVLLLAGNGLVFYAVTTASPEFMVMLTLAVLIPAHRQLEAVGDVQSIINYGLTLPLLLMAGPPLAVLLPLLLLVVPFREAEARQRPQVFAAMLLVAFVPTLIIVLGVWAMVARSDLALWPMIEPFWNVFARGGAPLAQEIVFLVCLAPILVVTVLHLAIPDRRRKFQTSFLALGVPIYLLVGNALFAWPYSSWMPAMAMLGAAAGWLGSTRIRPWMRWLTLALLLVGLVASWALASAWADAVWLDGLTPILLFAITWPSAA